MNIGRFIGTAVLAAALFAGCKKKDNAAPTEGSGSAPAGSAAPAAGSAGSAAPAAGSADSAATGSAATGSSDKPIQYGVLREIGEKLPKPEAKGLGDHWKVNSSSTEDGYMETWWVDAKDTLVISVSIADCRSPAAIEAKKSKPDDRGIWEYCYDETNGTLGAWPVVKILDPDNSLAHVIKVGHTTVTANPNTNVRDKITDADVEAYLKSLDLTALSKL